MCIYIQRFFALGKGLDRQCCTVLDENCCRPGVVEESQQQGPGLERPKTAQKPAQPNEPSLWVRVWLGHFLGYFWFSNPDPKVYRISEPETNTKSETNFEQDLRHHPKQFLYGLHRSLMLVSFVLLVALLSSHYMLVLQSSSLSWTLAACVGRIARVASVNLYYQCCWCSWCF